MKIEIIYYELKRREFRSEKTLRAFMKTKLDNEILRVTEWKNNCCYMVELKNFINNYRYSEE